MNLFAFDPDPWVSALWLDDVRKNKMILESAQMLSTAVRMLSPSPRQDVYRPTHVSHPACRWVRESKYNFFWTLDWMTALYKQRGRDHASAKLIPIFDQFVVDGRFPVENLTPFANCAANQSVGVSFKHMEDTHEAYKHYICARWEHDQRPPVWWHGKEPEWRVSYTPVRETC